MAEIRRAKASDAQAILEFCKAVGGESDNLTFDGRGLPVTLEQETEFLKAMEEPDKQFFFVAWEDGEIVGTCSYAGFTRERLAHRGEIAISVRKALWGRHIGSQLMETALAMAKDIAGAEIISLEVRSDNKRAIALYEKFGFEKIGCFKGFLKIQGQWVDCDLMNLYL